MLRLVPVLVVPALSLAFVGLVQGMGITLMDVLRRYAQALTASGSKLVIVSASERIQEQLRVTGITDLIGPGNIYPGDERMGATLKRAYADAAAWIENNQRAAGTDPQPP